MANKKRQGNSNKRRQEGAEKRTVPRLKREVIVQYRVKEISPLEGKQGIFEPHIDISRTKDLSEKGISFTVSRAIPAQAVLEIKLKLPILEKSIGLEGRVVGCEEIKKDLIYTVRVVFINLEREERNLLKGFVQLFLKT